MKDNKERWVIAFTHTDSTPLVFHWDDESWTEQDVLDCTEMCESQFSRARDCTPEEEKEIESLQLCKEEVHEVDFY